MNKSKLMIALLFAVCLMFLARPALSEDAYKIQYMAEFPQVELSFDKLMGYDMVTLKDGDFLTELGKPMLPSKELKIALPAGMAVKSVQVVNTTEVEIPGEFNIFPAQPPLKIGLSDKNADFVEPNKEIYSSSQPYPSKLVEFVRQSDLAGQGIAVIAVYPLQYVPSEKRLTLYTSLTLIIEGVGGYECGDYLSPNISEKNRKIYEQMVKDMVANPMDVQLNASLKMSTTMVPPGGPFAHVVITSNYFSSYFQPLADWHTQKGVRDTVITTDWIYAHYSGSTNQQKIRNFVIDANSSWGTTYFLMGGEEDTVPWMHRTYYASEPNTPSDEYYSDYDDDWTNEVFVGRASVGNTTEINTFVNKVLKYEKDPPRTNYPLDVLLIGMDVDAETPCEVLKDTIDNYIPPQFNVTKVYDSDGTNHRTATINALNAGQNLVNHADHANIDVMCTGDLHHGWYISSSDVDNLNNNNQTSIIFSVGCFTTDLDTSFDCIAEHFVIYNPNQAAVAFTGNTRDGFFNSGNLNTLSNRLDKLWWFALFKNNAYNLGQTLANAKHNFSTPGGVEKHCEWTLNLLGDPEMSVWTDSIDSFAVTHPDTVPRGASPFPVHVEDATTHANVNQAYVCLWKPNEVYLTGYTNASGDVTLNPSPSTGGTLYVTVTMHNYLPYQRDVYALGYTRGDVNEDGTINIQDVVYLINCLYVWGSPCPDPQEAGDVNCDGLVNAGDVVYLINYLFVPGSPAPCS